MFPIVAKSGSKIFLGRVGEHDTRCVEFSIEKWRMKLGDGSVQLTVQRDGDKTPYPAVITVEGDTVRWIVSIVDTAVAGYGKCQLTYLPLNGIAKSESWTTKVEKSMGDPSDEPPAEQQPWVDQVLQAGSIAAQSSIAASRSAADAEQSANLSAESAQYAAHARMDANAAAQVAESAKNDSETAKEETQELVQAARETVTQGLQDVQSAVVGGMNEITSAKENALADVSKAVSDGKAEVSGLVDDAKQNALADVSKAVSDGKAEVSGLVADAKRNAESAKQSEQNAKQSEQNAKESENRVAAAEGELNQRMDAVEKTASDAKQKSETAEAIARGKAGARVFDTYEEMIAWLADPAHIATLVIGDNLLIRDTDVPDYWWDGTQPQELETQKIDLHEYAKTADVTAALAKKQGTISDLEAIRSGAAAGATALQEVPDTYRTAADQDEIDTDLKNALSEKVDKKDYPFSVADGMICVTYVEV